MPTQSISELYLTDRSFLPLTYLAIEKGTYNSILNPPNVGKNAKPNLRNILPKTARGFLRFIYQAAVGILCCPAGLIYHTGAALVYKGKSWKWKKQDPEQASLFSTIAREHLKSAAKDASGAIFVRESGFTFMPEEFLEDCAPDTPIDLSSISRLQNATNPSIAYSPPKINIIFFGHMPDPATHINQIRSWHVHEINIHQRCSYKLLVKAANVRWQEGIPLSRMDNPQIIEAAVNCLNEKHTLVTDRTVLPERYEKIEVAPLLGRERPTYSISWEALAIAVIAVVAMVFAVFVGGSAVAAIVAHLIAGNIGNVLLLTYCLPALWAATAFCAVGSHRYLKEARDLYLEKRGTEELNFSCKLAEKLTIQMEVLNKEGQAALKKSIGAWIVKARDRGNSEAQMLYGMLLLQKALLNIAKLADSDELENQRWANMAVEGLEWIAIAARNDQEKYEINFLLLSIQTSISASKNIPSERLIEALRKPHIRKRLTTCIGKTGQSIIKEIIKNLPSKPSLRNFGGILASSVASLIDIQQTKNHEKIVKQLDSMNLMPSALNKIIVDYITAKLPKSTHFLQ